MAALDGVIARERVCCDMLQQERERESVCVCVEKNNWETFNS